MKKISKLLITSIVSLCLMVSFVAPAFAATGSGDYVSNTFKYSSHDNAAVSDLYDEYVYSDSYFYESGYEANPSLATMSIQLAASSITTHDYEFGTTERYENGSQNVQALLTDLGFEEIEINNAYTVRPTTTSMGVCCGYKTITVDGEEVTLLAIVPRSAGYEREWNSNFTVGKNEIHQGFNEAKNTVIEFAQKYVNDKGLSGRVKVWTVGYSRGAATANLVGAELDKVPNCLGITIDPEDVYAYCFGTPRTVLATANPDPASDEFDNIHNYFADYDLVTYAALPSWGFTRYGAEDGYTDIIYDSDEKEEMLTYLNIYFPMNYETYTSGAVGDPDFFYPKKIAITESGIGLVDDDESDIPYTQKEFLDDRTEWIKKSLVPDQETYVDENYQKALSEFIQMYFGMSDEQDSIFNQNLGMEALIGFGLLYVDYQLGIFVKDLTMLASLTPEDLEDLGFFDLDDIIEDTGADFIGDDSDFGEEIQDIMDSQEFEDLMDDFDDLENLGAGEDPTDLLVAIRGAIKSIAEGLLAYSFQRAGEASGAIPEEIANVISPTNLTAFTSFVEYILFGCEEETFDPLNLENPSLKYAATFIGNAGSFMRVHNNEIITSWVRVNDPNYNLVDFDSQGGSDVDSSYAVRTRGIILPEEDPTKDGYEFTGWYYNPECTQKYEGEDIEDNLTLYAGWEEEKPDVPLTGDSAPVVPMMLLAAASIFGLTLALRKRKEK